MMLPELPMKGPLRGRGAVANVPNRFDRLEVVADEDGAGDEPRAAPTTQFFRDTAKSIVAYNDSPDIGFGASINPYRGCEHGCIYCYARPTHEYLGLSAGLDFETRIFVKADAPQLLRRELASPRWRVQTLAISGVTDAYQPVERRLRLTRGCLEVLAECGHPVVIITKNATVTRDLDVLAKLARVGAAAVFISVTTLDAELAAKMEPRTSVPQRRLAAIEAVAAAGVPVGVLVAPVIPGLTDHELSGIIAAAGRAGARFAGYQPVRLPLAVAPLFEEWLGAHFPERKDKVLNRIRAIRGGKLNDPNFHSRMRGEGVFAQGMKAMFELARRRAGMQKRMAELSTQAFVRPTLDGQGMLFA